MKLSAVTFAGALAAAVLVAPLAVAAPATADEGPLKITSATLARGSVVVQGTYSCDTPFKARFIRAGATQFQYQGEDETEVRAAKSLTDRPCTGGSRRFQITVSPKNGTEFLPAADGATPVYVEVELTVTDQNNYLEDEAFNMAVVNG